MTSVQDLIDSLSQAVNGLPSGYHSASAACDIYEGYVFGLVIRAAKASGAGVTYRNVYGQSVNSLVFRTSPGMLHSRTHPYTHAVLELPACYPLEVHVGVRVQGRSNVLHECDVLVLSKSEADLSRDREVAPRGGRSLLAVECKYYANSLSLYLARGFHGLHSDLGLKYPLFVANVRAGNVERYLSHHKRKWENGVVPGTREETYLEGQIREAFKEFRAMRGRATP